MRMVKMSMMTCRDNKNIIPVATNKFVVKVAKSCVSVSTNEQ